MAAVSRSARTGTCLGGLGRGRQPEVRLAACSQMEEPVRIAEGRPHRVECWPASTEEQAAGPPPAIQQT